MSQTIIQVDAFTDRPFAGNPAGVCVLPEPREEKWMQDVAREMNLAETAFLYKQADGYNLRWFTPTVEVALCGHATLASAHVLWQTGQLGEDTQARFYTQSGLLTANRKGAWIEMDFPATPEEKTQGPDVLAQGLGVEPKYVGKSVFDYLVEVESEEVLRSLQPNFGMLKPLGVRGVVVTSLSSAPEYDFVSRYFAPGSGIDEDPVTGSTHCCLGPFWSARLDRTELTGYQASARGGIVRVHTKGDRVLLSGQAVTILRCELLEL
ncbi:MAG TPA: PhzF family phenazine biosynthesis protein [Pyrinomonadaceae bacterium]|jgi:PhzF family phenazine biosynthesis protein